MMTVTFRLLAIGLLFGAGKLASQQVEVFPVASGKPLFGEAPQIAGNIVVWQRYAGDDPVLDPAVIQFRDIGRGDNPIVDLVPYPANRTVFLSPTHLFWGWETIYARPIEELHLGIEGENILVAGEAGHPHIATAANREFVFFTGDVEYPGGDGGCDGRGKYFAKEISRLADPSPESIRLVTEVKCFAPVVRRAAASEEFFVWSDSNPDIPEDPYKIYAKRISELFVPGAEFLVLDSGLDFRGICPEVAVYGRTLLARVLGPDNHLQIVLVYLEHPSTVISLAGGAVLSNPSVSSEYAVWYRWFPDRASFAVRLEDGLPAGDPFQVVSGGDFVSINRNIAVWNGVVRLPDEVQISTAIMAAELPTDSGGEGDVDQNGTVNLTDAILILNYLFLGGWQPRRRLADVDRSGTIGISDALVVLRYLFAGEPLP